MGTPNEACCWCGDRIMPTGKTLMEMDVNGMKTMTAKDVQITVNILMEAWGLQMRPAAGAVVELKPHHLHRVLLLQALHLCRQQLVMIAVESQIRRNVIKPRGAAIIRKIKNVY